jgi:ubiquinone/menaquinone biosynthesis C-methylase UbiE
MEGIECSGLKRFDFSGINSMSEIGAGTSQGTCHHYDANYGHFQSQLYEEIRREAFGEDIGQSSWITADEQDRYLTHLKLTEGKSLLDVACGSGGPALRIAKLTGCSLVGVDVHEQAIAAGNEMAAQRKMSNCRFQVVDASQALPFPDNGFDALTCIDAINHLPDRPAVIADWARVLKPGGRTLFTDPITVTGPLTKSEIAIRSSIGFFLFVPLGYDEQVILQSGLRLVLKEDVTANMARLAAARRAARAKRSEALRKIEGDPTYEGQQEFFKVAAQIASEGRLSRFVYIAEK